MSLLLLLLVAAVLVVACCPAAPPTSAQEAPSLAPELKRLEAWVGTWDAEVSMMGQTTKGSEVCRIECGGNWLVTEHTGSFMGQPFQGKGLTGFDATKSAYSGVWIDSSGGPMSVFANGQFAKDGKSFTALVDSFGMDGKPGRFEYLTTFVDAKTRVFEITQVDGGKKELQMRIRYTRRG
jgi:hypothetical protein